jgi:hypothetical protein
MCISLLGCAALIPGIFVIGANDSPGEILAILYCGFLFLPTLIFALWRRRIAGVILMSMGPVWIFGMLDQRYYIQAVRHFPPDSVSDLLFRELPPALIPTAIGVFLFVTDRKNWPTLIPRRRFADEP